MSVLPMLSVNGRLGVCGYVTVVHFLAPQVRLSVGLETTEDLIEDLDQALEKSFKK